MRSIGALPTEKDAVILADYLLTKKIETSVRPAQTGWTIWVLHEDRLAEAAEEFKRFAENPGDARYNSAEEEAKRIKRVEAEKDRAFRRNYRRISKSYGPLLPRRAARSRPLTLGLVVVSTAVWIAMQPDDFRERVTDMLSIASSPGLPMLLEIRQGQVWRLITPIFLHFGISHLIFNMLAVFSLGGLIEEQRGTRRFALLVLGAAVVANLAQYFWVGPNFGGMSGVGFALFGYALVQGRYYRDPQLTLTGRTTLIWIAWLIVCTTGRVGPIANTAHFVGFAVGLIAGLVPYRSNSTA